MRDRLLDIITLALALAAGMLLYKLVWLVFLTGLSIVL